MTTIIALILSIPVLYWLPKIPQAGDVLRSLGVDETAPVMAVFFGIAYFFVSNFIVKPYRQNLEYRQKNTGGSLSEANQLNAEAETIFNQYKVELKKQNEETQKVYEKLKSEGIVEEDKIVTAARKQASDLIEQTKKSVAVELAASRDKLKSQVPQISELVASRVLGRDLS